MNVEVVLTQNDPKLGKRGDVVKVSHGFAHNFLIPNGKAKLATSSSLKGFEKEKEREAAREAKDLAQARELAQKISGLSLTLELSVGEGDKPFGSVTSHEIAQKLQSQGLAVEKKEVQLSEPIKQLGTFQVPIKIHPEVSAKLKLWIVKK